MCHSIFVVTHRSFSVSLHYLLRLCNVHEIPEYVSNHVINILTLYQQMLWLLQRLLGYFLYFCKAYFYFFKYLNS